MYTELTLFCDLGLVSDAAHANAHRTTGMHTVCYYTMLDYVESDRIIHT